MADDKRGRDKKAHDAANRRLEQDILRELERGDETEPPTPDEELDLLETELHSLSFPATGSEIIETVGDQEIESDEGPYAVEAVIPATSEELFESPEDVRVRAKRPTIAAAMKEILEASEQHPNAELRGSQREAYEKTLRALKAIDADDDDEGIQVITDWIVERIHEKERPPGSRDVRRQAANFCRANDYQIRNDEWLGV